MPILQAISDLASTANLIIDLAVALPFLAVPGILLLIVAKL